MPKNSYAEDTVGWSMLLSSVEKHGGDMTFLKDLLSELELILKTVTALEHERLQLKARSQQITKDVDTLKVRARSVAGRIRSGIKSQYGYSSEQLIQFGLQPRRRKVQDRIAEEEALAKLSDSDPVS